MSCYITIADQQRAFIREQEKSGPGLPLGDGVSLYPNGARYQNVLGLDANLIEPPTGKFDLLTLQIAYWEMRLGISMSAFEDTRASCRGEYRTVNWRPKLWGKQPPHDGAEDYDIVVLIWLQNIVKKERTTLEELEAEFDDLPVNIRKREQKAAREAAEKREAVARQKAHNKRQKKISSITI